MFYTKNIISLIYVVLYSLIGYRLYCAFGANQLYIYIYILDFDY